MSVRIFLAGTMLWSAALHADTMNWIASAGGDLDAAGNWSPSMPGSSDVAYIADLVDCGTLTLAGTSFKPYTFQIQTGKTAILNPGSGKEVYAQFRFIVDGSAGFRVQSGSCGIDPAVSGERVFLGLSTPGNTLVVENSGTVLRGSSSAFICVGQDHPNNTLKIATGAAAYGCLSIGNNAGSDRNSVWVMGAGSKFICEDGRLHSVGGFTDKNSLIVTNGASLSVAGTIRVSSVMTTSASAYGGGDYNLMRVATGASAVIGGELTVGCGGHSNTLEVTDGSFLTAENLFVGDLAYVKRFTGGVNVMIPTSGNVFNLAGTGSRCQVMNFRQGNGMSQNGVTCVKDGGRLDVRSSFIFGNATAREIGGVANELFNVGNGGTVSFAGTKMIVGGGHTTRPAKDCLMKVDTGGVFAANGTTELVVGDGIVSDRNAIRVEGLFVMTNEISGTVYLGYGGSSNRWQTVSGGVTEIGTNLVVSIGQLESARHNELVVSRGGRFTAVNPKGDPRISCIGGAANGVRVNGGELDAENFFVYLGGAVTASNCWMEVSDGGKVDVRRLMIGDSARDCSLLVSNGTVNVLGPFSAGYGVYNGSTVDSVGARLHFSGTNSVLNIAGACQLYSDSSIHVDLPCEKAFEKPLVRASSFSTCRNGDENGFRHAVTVSLATGGCDGYSATLLETTDADIGDEDFARLDFNLPDGVLVERTARKIVLRVRSNRGTVMNFR